MSEYEEYVCRYYPDNWGEKTIALFGVPIVRCRDCRYFRIGTNTDSCGFTDKYAHHNGFCAWGELRGDAE